MPVGQLPLALAQHVVDGCLVPWHLVPTLRLNDVLKAHTEFSDFSLSSRTYVLAMNKTVYDRLPREIKTPLDKIPVRPSLRWRARCGICRPERLRTISRSAAT